MIYAAQMQLKGYDLDRVEVEALGLDPERCFRYGNSGSPELRSVLRSLTIASGSRIVDLGCGKGGAMLIMAEFAFSQIIGVDISADLLAVAAQNCAHAKVSNRVHFVEADAGLFDDWDDFDYIYLYDPFPKVVFEEVLVNVVRSLDRKERNMTVIYKNPNLHQEILDTGRFHFDREIRFPPPGHNWNTFHVYVHSSREINCGTSL